MSDSTCILDLPTDPVGGGNISNGINASNGISLTATETGEPSTSQLSGVSLDQSTINQIVNGLQQASSNGGTQLPSRDIPMMTTGHSNDPQVRPNYVPPPPLQNADYIQNYEESSDMINTYNKQMQNSSSLDDMYNEIQTPLLIAVLYFLFQLPFVRKFLFTYIPFLFSIDGNLNMNGYLFTSILFGVVFYSLNKLSWYCNTF